MRWSDGELDKEESAALPGLVKLSSLVRSVQTPEFAGITFHEVLAKTALNHIPGGGTSMPFGWTINPYRGCSHACVYCLGAETRILMGDGSQKPLRDIRVGDVVYGTEVRGRYRRYVRTRVIARYDSRKRAHRIELEDGTRIVASGEHRFLTERGWKHVTGAERGPAARPHLTTNNALVGFGTTGIDELTQPPFFDADYRRGYLTGMIRGDAHLGVHSEALARTKTYLSMDGIETRWRADEPTEWHLGFLAGIFDAEGSHSRGVLRISNGAPDILDQVRQSMDELGVGHRTDGPAANGVYAVRVIGGLQARQRFFRLVGPAISRKLSLEGFAVKSSARLRVVQVEDLGVERAMVDITTGTGDFIANGVIAHNCFARNTHTYLDLDSGKDFDNQIIVKVNVAEVLAKELAKPTWQHPPVALGTNTDPYQRAEGKYRLMPGIISALAASGTPFSILTKGSLLRRDLPLIADAAERVPVDLAMSIAIYDDELQQSLEPGTPTTKSRLATVAAAREHGLDCSVFMMPILPFLTDTRAHLETALGQIREAGANSVLYSALHLRVGAKEWFMQWLVETHPELVPRYTAMYARGAYAPKEYRAWLGAKIRPIIRSHGLERSAGPPMGAVRATALRRRGHGSLIAEELPPSFATAVQPTLF